MILKGVDIMKKLLALIIVTFMLCGLVVGCTESNTDTSGTESTVTSSDLTSSDETSSDETIGEDEVSSGASSEEASSTTSSETTPVPTVFSKQVIFFTVFSDEHPLDINCVMRVAAGNVANVDDYLTETDTEYGMWSKFVIHEQVMLDAARSVFVISDEFWADIKAYGTYEFFGDDCEYSNGNFYITRIYGWGGAADEFFELKKIIDSDNTITIYYLFMDDNFVEHHYIEVVYTYSVSAEYTLKTEEFWNGGYFESESEAFIDSLRLKSVKAVHNFPGNTEPQRHIEYVYGETGYYFYWYENDPEHIELFGCAGEFDLPCSCGEPGLCENWHYGQLTKTVTCPCGATVMTDPIHDQPIYR